MSLQSTFIFLFFLVSSSIVSAQDDYSNEDWRPLNYYTNGNFQKSVEACNSLLEKQSEGIAKNRTRFILARANMEREQYGKAIEILSHTELDAAFFKSGIPGLIGDCKSIQKKYDEALDYYNQAIRAEWNNGTTPHYLFKAYLCAKELDRIEEGQQYIQTIRFYFQGYSDDYGIDKYVILDDIDYFKLTPPSYDQPSELGIGTFNGKNFDQVKFAEACNIAHTNAQLSAQQTGLPFQPVDENIVWHGFISDKIRTSEYQRLKLRSDQDEFDAYLYATDGFSPQLEFINHTPFIDENGDFQSNLLRARVNEMKESQDQSQVEAWKNTKNYYYKKLIFEKYERLAKLHVFVTMLEVEQKIAEEQDYTFNYRVLRNNELKEFDIDIPIEEQRAYYEKLKHTREYSVDEVRREISILQLNAKPSVNDTLKFNKRFNDIKKLFQETKNDSLFVLRLTNNGMPFYTSGPYSTAVPVSHRKASEGKYITYPDGLSSVYEEAEIGEIVGPYEFNNKQVITKVIGRTYDTIEARHILIDNEHSEYYAREFYKKVTNKNFTELAKENSADLGSKEKGGELGSFFFGDMVPEFATYCAEAPIGQIGLVQTQFGYHIVQVTERRGKQYPRLAIIQMPIQLGKDGLSKTKEHLNLIREDYIAELEYFEDYDSYSQVFEEIAGDYSLNTHDSYILENTPRFYDLGSKSLKDSLLKFSFSPDVTNGDISKIFVDSNQMLLVVFGRKSKVGSMPFEVMQNQVRREMFWEAKSDILLERLRKHTSKEIENLKQWTNSSLNQTDLNDIGNESSIIAKAIHAYKNGTNGIYEKGHSAVIYIEVDRKENSDLPINILETRNALSKSREDSFHLNIIPYLLLTNVVIDNRDPYRLGVRK